MSKYANKDYIPTYSDLAREELRREESVKEARKHGFRLGEYEISYKLNGIPRVEKVCGHSKNEAIEAFKADCSLVGWIPADIDVKTLVEPNIYV